MNSFDFNLMKKWLDEKVSFERRAVAWIKAILTDINHCISDVQIDEEEWRKNLAKLEADIAMADKITEALWECIR